MILGLMADEANYTRWVLDQLTGVAWARPLLASIQRQGGVTQGNAPLLFEARVAYELWRQGIAAQYEFQAGVGTSSVDFRLPSSPAYLIEVVSLQASAAIKAATREVGGIYQMLLMSENLDPANPKAVQKQSEEAEFVSAQVRLGEKVFADGKPTKFPLPQPDTYHVILVDFRGFNGGEPELFPADLYELTYGQAGLRFINEPVSHGLPDGSGQLMPLTGIFEKRDDHPLRAAPFLQERVHAIHFVNEQRFEPGELSSHASSRIVPNVALLQGRLAHFASSYPLMNDTMRRHFRE